LKIKFSGEKERKEDDSVEFSAVLFHRDLCIN